MVQGQDLGTVQAGVGPATTARLSQLPDRRADGHVRSVSLTRDLVRIDRRLHGIAMRLSVPVRAYRGVALSLQPGRDGELCYRLHLLHRDRDLSVDLDMATDDGDILADWRVWSRFFGLPALVERQAGWVVEADPSLVGNGPVERRASRFRSPRRPRFLRRRKMGVWPVQAMVHDSRDEIIARD